MLNYKLNKFYLTPFYVYEGQKIGQWIEENKKQKIYFCRASLP